MDIAYNEKDLCCEIKAFRVTFFLNVEFVASLVVV